MNHEPFPKQDAPNKNTDKAFVKVGKDGSPQLPGEGKEQKKEKEPSRPKPQESSRH